MSKDEEPTLPEGPKSLTQLRTLTHTFDEMSRDLKDIKSQMTHVLEVVRHHFELTIAITTLEANVIRQQEEISLHTEQLSGQRDRLDSIELELRNRGFLPPVVKTDE